MAFMELLKEHDILNPEDFAKRVKGMSNKEILSLYDALLDDLLQEPLLCSLCLDDIRETVRARGDMALDCTASMCMGLLTEEFVVMWNKWNLSQKVRGLWDKVKEICRSSRELITKYAPILMRRLTSIKGYRKLESIGFSFSVTGPDIVFTFKKAPRASKKTMRKKKSS